MWDLHGSTPTCLPCIRKQTVSRKGALLPLLWPAQHAATLACATHVTVMCACVCVRVCVCVTGAHPDLVEAMETQRRNYRPSLNAGENACAISFVRPPAVTVRVCMYVCVCVHVARSWHMGTPL